MNASTSNAGKMNPRLIFTSLIVVVVSIVLISKWYSGRLSITQQADAAFQEGDTELGRSLLLKHLASHPDNDDARWTLASSYAKSEPEIAIQHFQQVSNSSKKYRDAQRSIFLMASERSLYDKAEQALDRLLELNPEDFGPKLAKAELYYQGKRNRDAIPLIEEAIKANPQRAESFLLLADNFFELNRVSEAIAPLRQALKLSPESMVANANLAYALHYNGELDEAKKTAIWCLKRDKNIHQVRTILANIYRDQGQNQAALDEINLVLKSNNDDFDARILKAEILIFQRLPKEALVVLDPLYKNNSSNRKVLSNLARAAAMSGNREAARKYQQELAAAIKANPRSAASDFIPTTD